MDFKDVIAQEPIKEELYSMLTYNKIPQGLFFLGEEGYGSMALALSFAKKVLEIHRSSLKEVNLLKDPDFHCFGPHGIKKIKEPLKNLRDFLIENPYEGPFKWLDTIGLENKQGQIGIEAIENMLHITQLKSYYNEGYKVILLWSPDRLNHFAANKLLKTLEDLPLKTIFLFVGEDSQEILPTIKSRFHIIPIYPIKEKDIYTHLIKSNVIEEKAKKISIQVNGNWSKALKRIKKDPYEAFEEDFISWIRISFLIKKNKSFFKDLVSHCEKLASWEKEKQKGFLYFTLEIIQQSLLGHYTIKDNKSPFALKEFQWDNFCRFIHSHNITELYTLINTSIYHIKRNANAKMLFFDLSIHLSNLLNKKPL